MRIDSFLNNISDKDEQWGPLLFLRPGRHERMSLVRVFALALLLGGLFGMMGSIVLALTARGVGRAVPPVYVMPAALTFIYFLVCRFTIASAWNRRAQRLAKLRQVTLSSSSSG